MAQHRESAFVYEGTTIRSVVGGVEVFREGTKPGGALSICVRLRKLMPSRSLILALTDWKDLATIVGVLIAAATLIKGVFEYSQQGKQRRAERFLNLRQQLDSEEAFSKIINALDDDVAQLKTIPAPDKRYFLALFEQVALMMNSGLIPKAVVHYMFGYYAIRAWETYEFWHNMESEKNDPHWALFSTFAKDMKLQESLLANISQSSARLNEALKL